MDEIGVGTVVAGVAVLAAILLAWAFVGMSCGGRRTCPQCGARRRGRFCPRCGAAHAPE